MPYLSEPLIKECPYCEEIVRFKDAQCKHCDASLCIETRSEPAIDEIENDATQDEHTNSLMRILTHKTLYKFVAWMCLVCSFVMLCIFTFAAIKLLVHLSTAISVWVAIRFTIIMILLAVPAYVYQHLYGDFLDD